MELDPDIQPWMLAWLESRDDPLRFVTGVLGVNPEKWQREVLAAIRDGHKRISVRSGHGVGKTTLFAWLTLWGVSCHRDAKLPIAANSQQQLRDTVWSEIAKWHKMMPPELGDQIEIDATRVFMKADPELSFAVARTCTKENTEALAGFHAAFLCFLIDEASGIPDVIFEVMLGALSTPDAIVVMCGNPTRTSGYFFDSHHKNRQRWYTIRVNSEDYPRARGHIEDIAETYGTDSNQYRVRVLGEFPNAADDVLISLKLVMDATVRDVQAMDVLPVWGVDPARFGDDRSALCKRRGNVVDEPIQFWRMRDTMTLAGIIAAEYEKTPVDDRPIEICVDVIGIGAGVVDRLDEIGLPVRGVNVAESPSTKGNYLRLRDELYFKARDWFEARDCRLFKDEALISELVEPTFTFTSAGKLVVEQKDQVKKRGLPSPDLAEAFILTFAADDYARIKNDKHRKPPVRQTSAWAA